MSRGNTEAGDCAGSGQPPAGDLHDFDNRLYGRCPSCARWIQVTQGTVERGRRCVFYRHGSAETSFGYRVTRFMQRLDGDKDRRKP